MISDLKAKLPLKKKDEEYDESEEIQEEVNSSQQDDETGTTDVSEVDLDEVEEPGDSSLIHKLKSKIQSLQKKPTSGKATPSGDDKKKKIIYGLIGVGLLVILFSDEIFPPEPEQPAKPSFVRPERKKPVVKSDPSTEATETTPAVDPVPEAVDTSAATTETPSSTETPETTETPTDSAVDVTSTETAPVETMPTETTPETVSTPDETLETIPDETIPTETPSEDVTTSETTPMQDFTPSTDSVDGEVVPSDENLTDQILQDLEKQAKSSQITEAKKEYVAPPDYEYRGRGLVYNCTGKHWACVDAPSYKTCEENSSSTKFLNKPNECYPFNVYESPKGCELMQNRMVSSSAKTEFCND